MQKKGLAVIAVGGNALIKDKNHQSQHDQYQCAADTMVHIADMILDGWDVVITHGNGPQVGFILRRSELAAHEVHENPLDYCGAESQGSIGYMFAQSLHNEFLHRGIDKNVVSVVTQTIVDRNDPAFQNPTKPIGGFMDEAAAREKRENECWTVGRMFRGLCAGFFRPSHPHCGSRRHSHTDRQRFRSCCRAWGIPVLKTRRQPERRDGRDRQDFGPPSGQPAGGSFHHQHGQESCINFNTL